MTATVKKSRMKESERSKKKKKFPGESALVVRKEELRARDVRDKTDQSPVLNADIAFTVVSLTETSPRRTI